MSDREDAVSRREDAVSRREERAVPAVSVNVALISRLQDFTRSLQPLGQHRLTARHITLQRDKAADLAAFVRAPAGDDSYGSENPSRRHAALDREHAKEDRVSSADDRDRLTGDPVTEQ